MASSAPREAEGNAAKHQHGAHCQKLSLLKKMLRDDSDSDSDSSESAGSAREDLDAGKEDLKQKQKKAIVRANAMDKSPVESSKASHLSDLLDPLPQAKELEQEQLEQQQSKSNTKKKRKKLRRRKKSEEEKQSEKAEEASEESESDVHEKVPKPLPDRRKRRPTLSRSKAPTKAQGKAEDKENDAISQSDEKKSTKKRRLVKGSESTIQTATAKGSTRLNKQLPAQIESNGEKKPEPNEAEAPKELNESKWSKEAEKEEANVEVAPLSNESAQKEKPLKRKRIVNDKMSARDSKRAGLLAKLKSNSTINTASESAELDHKDETAQSAFKDDPKQPPELSEEAVSKQRRPLKRLKMDKVPQEEVIFKARRTLPTLQQRTSTAEAADRILEAAASRKAAIQRSQNSDSEEQEPGLVAPAKMVKPTASTKSVSVQPAPESQDLPTNFVIPKKKHKSPSKVALPPPPSSASKATGSSANAFSHVDSLRPASAPSMMTVTDRLRSGGDDSTGSLTPSLSPILPQLQPKPRRRKAVIAPDIQPMRMVDQEFFELALKHNSILVACELTEGASSDQRLPHPYCALDTQGNVIKEKFLPMTCPTRRELKNQEVYGENFFGINLKCPAAEAEAKAESDTQDQKEAKDDDGDVDAVKSKDAFSADQDASQSIPIDDSIPCYEPLAFEDEESREWFQEKVYGTVFVPLWCRQTVILSARSIRYQRKSTGIMFNIQNEKEEFVQSLTKRFTMNKTVPRVFIPPRSWKSMMTGQPSFVLLHYRNRADSLKALQLFRDDDGNPLDLRSDIPGVRRKPSSRVPSRSPSPSPSRPIMSPFQQTDPQKNAENRSLIGDSNKERTIADEAAAAASRQGRPFATERRSYASTDDNGESEREENRAYGRDRCWPSRKSQENQWTEHFPKNESFRPRSGLHGRRSRSRSRSRSRPANNGQFSGCDRLEYENALRRRWSRSRSRERFPDRNAPISGQNNTPSRSGHANDRMNRADDTNQQVRNDKQLKSDENVPITEVSNKQMEKQGHAMPLRRSSSVDCQEDGELDPHIVPQAAHDAETNTSSAPEKSSDVSLVECSDECNSILEEDAKEPSDGDDRGLKEASTRSGEDGETTEESKKSANHAEDDKNEKSDMKNQKPEQEQPSSPEKLQLKELTDQSSKIIRKNEKQNPGDGKHDDRHEQAHNCQPRASRSASRENMGPPTHLRNERVKDFRRSRSRSFGRRDGRRFQDYGFDARDDRQYGHEQYEDRMELGYHDQNRRRSRDYGDEFRERDQDRSRGMHRQRYNDINDGYNERDYRQDRHHHHGYHRNEYPGQCYDQRDDEFRHHHERERRSYSERFDGRHGRSGREERRNDGRYGNGGHSYQR